MIYHSNETRINVLDNIINENITFFSSFDENVILEGEKFDTFKTKAKELIRTIISKIKAIKDWIVEKVTSLIDKVKAKFTRTDLQQELRKAEAAVQNESTRFIHESITKAQLGEFLNTEIECVNYIIMVRLMKRFHSYLSSNTTSYNQPAPKVSDLLYHLAEKPVYDLQEFVDTCEKKGKHNYAFFIHHFSSLSQDINFTINQSFMDKCLNFYDGIIMSLEKTIERIDNTVSTDVKDLKDLLTEYEDNEEEERGAKEKNKLALYNQFAAAVQRFFSMFLETVTSYNFHFSKCRNMLLAAQGKTA